MLTLENGMYILTALLTMSVIGYCWGALERQSEITLDEVFKETT